jgi:pyruvate-formate lyase-activating enzyme
MSLKASIEHIDSLNHLFGVATTIYLPECNLRCPYCFNMDLVNGIGVTEYKWIDFVSNVNKNKSGNFVVTGGEPTYNENFEKIISCLDALNVTKSIQINTNMLKPDKLSWFLSSVKNPIVAFDFKTTLKNYDEMNPLCPDCDGKFISSLFVLKRHIEEINPNIHIQCRTTLYKGIDLEKLMEMAEMLDSVSCKHFTWNLQDIYPSKEIPSEMVKDYIDLLKKDFLIKILYNNEEV